jgi:hypothetical protein
LGVLTKNLLRSGAITLPPSPPIYLYTLFLNIINC